MKINNLGEAIRAFRLRRRQVHSGRPWTLDDLAVAMDVDRAHLSRIERGQVQPSRATLLRIARALALSRPETEFLLGLSGHTLLFEPPDENEIQAAIRWLSATVLGYAHPIVLRTNDLRLWYVNALWLRLTGLTPAQFRVCVRGHAAFEARPGPCPSWERIYSRFRTTEAIQRRTLARLRTGVLGGEVPASLLASVHADERSRRLWKEIEIDLPEATATGQDITLTLWYPGRGRLRLHAWQVPLPIDRRFHVTHYLPKDRATREALAAIRRDPRPPRAEPCPTHRTTDPQARRPTEA